MIAQSAKETVYLDPLDTSGYLRALFEPGDWVNIQLIHQTEKYENGKAKISNNYARLEDALETLDSMIAKQTEGWNVYVAMNAFTLGLESRKERDIANIRTVYVEFDEDTEAGLARIADDIDAGLIPLVDFRLISSPGKAYVIWCVDGFTVPQQKALNKALQMRYGSDPQSVDASRVLRLPGTRNLKYDPTPIVTIEDEAAPHTRSTPKDFKIEYVVPKAVDRKAAPEKVQNRMAYYEQACNDAGVDAGDLIQKPDGSYNYVVACPNFKEHTTGGEFDASVWISPSGHISFGCFHSHCEDKDWADYYRRWLEEQAKKAGFKGFLKFGDASEVDQPSAGGQLELTNSQSVVAPPIQERYAMTPEEIEVEMEKEFPVIPLTEQPGPSWDDDLMYGICGDIVRKASQFCEAHPAGMYLDLLIAVGNIIGSGPYFNIDQTRHHANEFMVRVGPTSDGRKGTGRDVVDSILKMVAVKWHEERIMSGFGSAEAIINEIRDPRPQQIADKKTLTGFRTVVVPGVTDKRLCIREGEMASVFQLAGKKESRADIVLRDGWDSKPLRNLVKGKSRDGLSNSNVCMQPHLSISGDTTRSELLRKMPDGAADNGFGNRFLYCYVYRTKMCPMGGPVHDWSAEIPKLYEAIEWAQSLTYVPLTKAASKVWGRMYMELESPSSKLPGLAGAMTARAAAHIRRLALVYALLDEFDVVETRHLHAAKRIWDYCQESARFIFTGFTSDQEHIRQYIEKNKSVTFGQIRRDLFHDHKKAEWVRSQIEGLAREVSSGIVIIGDVVTTKT